MKPYILVFLNIFFYLTLSGQELKDPVNIQSPQAASLVADVNTPVSMFNGKVDVSIPLYTLSNHGMNMNISLSYDAAGVRVNEHPSVVGQNWSLSTGGVITRQVNFKQDERIWDNSFYPFEEPNIGFLYRHADILEEPMDISFLEDLAQDRYVRGIDYEPDIFRFNVMGKSGSFFMGNDGEWKVKSEHNFKVIQKPELQYPLFEDVPPSPLSLPDKYPKVIGGFKIIDDQGNTYIFGYNENAIEYSIDFFGQALGENWLANAWHLTSVIDRNGNVVFELEYDRKEFTANFFISCTGKQLQNVDEPGYLTFPDIACLSDPPDYNTTIPKNTNGKMNSNVYLSKITAPGLGSVYFNYEKSQQQRVEEMDLYVRYNDVAELFPNISYGNGVLYFLEVDNPYIDDQLDYFENLEWYKLSSILVNSPNDKMITFDYTDQNDQRLKLNRVNIHDRTWPYNDETTYSYEFEYFNFSQIPDYLSAMDDHYGYNMGSAYTIPSFNSGGPENFYTQKEPSPIFTKMGILQKIYWPTGGNTYFEYETSDYRGYVSNDRTEIINQEGIGGGLRIKSIRRFDGENSTSTSYEYVKNYSPGMTNSISSGILSFKNKYYWDVWALDVEGTDEVAGQKVFSTNTMVQQNNMSGPLIGYSEVAEIYPDGSYKINKFTNFDSGNEFMDEPAELSFHPYASPFNLYNDMSWKRGHLTYENIYSNNSKIIQKTTYEYDVYTGAETDNEVLYTNASLSNICPASAVNMHKGSASKLYYSDYLMNKTEVKVYNSEDDTFVESVEEYQYNNQNLIWKTITSNSNGKETNKYYKYAGDYKSLNPPDQSLLGKMLEKGMDGILVSEVTTVEDNNDAFQSKSKINKYELTNNSINLSEVNIFHPQPDNQAISWVDFGYDGEIIIPDDYNPQLHLSYDSFDNVREYQKENNVKTTVLWGYNYHYPIAKIKNASYNDVMNALGISYEQLQTKSSSELQLLFDDLRDHPSMGQCMISSYTYKKLIGITSMTDPNGNEISYEYDVYNRLKTIKDQDGNILKHSKYHYVEEYMDPLRF